jgi:N-acetyl sugar amidotransferase
MPRYCQRCILPDTRPGVLLDESGICTGCRHAETKDRIDWDARAGAFREVADRAAARATSYDCVIPVSGGKDSYWQVTTCLEHGLVPLCVSYVYPKRTALGEQNLRTLAALGVDHLELRPDPGLERAFVEKAFRRTGISGLVSHMAIYSWPLQVAVAQDIPLVVYGENAAFEYGSEDESLTGHQVDERWLRTFGVTNGTTAADWVDAVLTRKKLSAYFAPDPATLREKDVRAVFLGYYFRWDPENSRRIAVARGFSPRPGGARVGHYDFVNIDDDLIGVHHHPKWHKFGITRTWDTLSMEIRAGRLTRDEAIETLKRRGDETPWADIELFCEYLGVSQAEYFRILEGFRNHDLWTRRNGRWVIDDFLVPDFPWPADPA